MRRSNPDTAECSEESVRIISGESTHLQPAMMSRLARYRHEVFVQRLGWKLPCPDGIELDQFDREDTVYVVALDKHSGAIRGMARLLPTTGPYLLRDIFPALLHGSPAPASPNIWEISRFAVVELKAPALPGNAQFSSRSATALLRATIMCAAELGASELVSVSPVGIERLLQRAGLRFKTASPVAIDGRQLFACRIDTGQYQSAMGDADQRSLCPADADSSDSQEDPLNSHHIGEMTR
jgi:acyl homoserine lactone synthase